jgi:carboxymethylenebutenolidase
MAMHTEWVRYGDGYGYIAWPERATLPLPGVVVIQEIWGVEEHIQEVVRRIAAAGYVALAPDLYSHQGERLAPLTRERIIELQAFLGAGPPSIWSDAAAREAELAKRPEDERKRLSETHAAVFSALVPGGPGMSRFVPALLAATKYLHHECDASRGRRTGCVGFCMGGGLSALLACEEPELSGAVVFYGNSPPAEKIPAIACPVLGLYASLDARINGGLPAFEQAMKEHGKQFERHIYEGASHGFFHDGRGSYHVDAARGSFVQMLEFFRRTLV